MAEKSNCPDCGRLNVKGRLSNSAVKGMAGAGAFAGLYLGPLGPLVGAPIGAVVGKMVNFVGHTVLGVTKVYDFKCPRCGCTWTENVSTK